MQLTQAVSAIAEDAEVKQRKNLSRAKDHYTSCIEQGKSITCIDCTQGYCCRNWVGAFVYEGVAICQKLINMGNDDAIHEVYQQGLAQIKPLLAYDYLFSYTGNLAIAEARNWFRKNEYCVFLKDHRCEIYDQRPMTCALHWALDTVDACNQPDETVRAIDYTNILRDTIQDSNLYNGHFTGGTSKAFYLPPLPLGITIKIGHVLLEDSVPRSTEEFKQMITEICKVA